MSNRDDDKFGTADHIYERFGELYEAKGLAAVPIIPGEKAPVIKDWHKLATWSPEDRAALRSSHRHCQVGLLAGTALGNGNLFGFVDVDHDGWVSFIEAVLGLPVVAKAGAKGRTIFIQAEPGTRSAKLHLKGAGAPTVEIFTNTGQTVIPPSRHPSGVDYQWLGSSLLDVELTGLPILTPGLRNIIAMAVKNPNAHAIVEAGADVKAHDLMLALTSCGIANLTEDLEWLANCLNALFHPDYAGNTRDETLGMLRDAKAKGLGASGSGKGKPTNADKLKVAVDRLGIELFHDTDGRGYIAIRLESGGTLCFQVRSRAAETWLRSVYFQAEGKGISAQALKDFIDTLEAQAIHEGAKRTVYRRVAFHDGALYVDLSRADALVVKITADGWETTFDCPVRFARSTGSQELPIPTRSGRLNDLKDLLHLEDDAWVLVLAFLLNCIRPQGPFMFLLVEGEQGSGKSMLCLLIKQLIDPNASTKMRLPESVRDLMVMAKEFYLLVFDNASGMKREMSDALCSLATGGGFATRALYTDEELHTFDFKRAVVINGISDFATRPDLQERAIPLRLPSMPDGARKTEREILSAFEAMRPGILGRLCDIAACALRNLDQVEPPTTVRMADAAHWLVAAEPEMGLPPGTITATLAAGQSELMTERVLNDPVVAGIQALLNFSPIEDTMGMLHSSLPGREYDRTFPATPSHLSKRLDEMQVALRKAGIFIEKGERTNRGRLVRIWREGQENQKFKPVAVDQR